MKKVILVGRLTRDPEMRALASGKTVTTFALTTNECAGNGPETAEHHAVVRLDPWVVVVDCIAPRGALQCGRGHGVAFQSEISPATTLPTLTRHTLLRTAFRPS